MNNASYLGAYRLESFVIESPSGECSDWGKNPHGLLIYEASGYMSVSINKYVEKDDSQTESENLFDSILFYSGTYSIDGSLIRHTVTEASNPSRIGKEMLRYAEWKGQCLHLKTPKESFGTATLVWKKL